MNEDSHQKINRETNFSATSYSVSIRVMQTSVKPFSFSILKFQCTSFLALKFVNITFFTENSTLFRQINEFTKEDTKELISRKFFSVMAFYSIFPHSTVWKFRNFTLSTKNFVKSTDSQCGKTRNSLLLKSFRQFNSLVTL